jgi:hypothetical protein
MPMLQEQLIEEIKQIPHEKLAEIYDLIHYFRLGLVQDKSAETILQRPIGLAKGQLEIPASFFEPLPKDILNAFEGIK